MRHSQRGLGMMGIMMVCIVLVLGAIGGLKVAPAYIEYGQVKKAVAGVAGGPDARGTVADIRKAFDKRAQVDDIQAVGGADLEITKEGGQVVISFAYQKKVPLFGNVSILFDFAGSSN